MTITPIRIDTFKHLTLDSSSIPSIALYSVLDFSSYSRIPFHFSSHEAGKKRESMKIIEEAKNSSLIAKEISESGDSQGIFDLRELNFFEARVNRISIEELKIKYLSKIISRVLGWSRERSRCGRGCFNAWKTNRCLEGGGKTTK